MRESGSKCVYDCLFVVANIVAPYFVMACEACGYRTAWLGMAPPLPFNLDCWRCGTVVTYRWLPGGASSRPHGPVAVVAPPSAGPTCALGAAAADRPSSPSLADLLDFVEATWAAEIDISSAGVYPNGERAPSALSSSPLPPTSRYVPPTEAVSDDEEVRPPAGGTAAPVVPALPLPGGVGVSPVIADAVVIVDDDEGNSVI